MANFLDFINNKAITKNNINDLNESFKTKDVDKVMGLIDSLLRKHVKNNIVGLTPNNSMKTTIDGQTYQSFMWFEYDKLYKIGCAFSLDFRSDANRGDVYSISFIDGKDAWAAASGEKVKAKTVVYTMGSSIVHFLPMIYTVLNTKNFDITNEFISKEETKIFGESRNYYIGALKHIIYEGLSDDEILNNYNLTTEAVDKAVKQVQNKKRAERDEAWDTWRADKSDKNKANRDRITQEYREILNAIQGGASTIDELKAAVKHNIDYLVPVAENIKAADKEITPHKGPDQAFKEMHAYVNSVIKGLQPGVIICGAPGVGKSFNVEALLKAQGKRVGHNLEKLKGNCSAVELYKSLYKYKEKGDIILIDDADAVVGPHAPETAINILKAALDSTSDDEGRYITYRVAGKLLDEEGIPIPKSCYFNGGVIILTNHDIGSLNTAIRGRVFTQSMNFTVDEILERIRKFIPKMDPEHLSMKSKMKAFDYISQLAKDKTKIEVSFRSFGTCARIFEIVAADEMFNDDDAKSMIKEQLQNQALKK